MREIHSETILPLIGELLSYATSKKRVSKEYRKYIQSPIRKLYAAERNGIIAGCIGVEFIRSSVCEIKHIAVIPSERRKRVGNEMIDFICDKHLLNSIFAETDMDAVEFYRNYGFEISSLGEKYQGVERFLCEYKA